MSEAFAVAIDRASILGGLVVNSGIILLDTTNQPRAHGLSRSAALIQSGQQCLRPILMTVITTVAGLSPMVRRFEPGAKIDRVYPEIHVAFVR